MSGARAPVGYERLGAAAVVTIEWPERRNAVDSATAVALSAALDRFEGDDGARVLVLTGAGEEAFCAGFDLNELAAAAEGDGIGTRLGAPEGPMGVTRRFATKPTIAAVSGWCVAGGLELALWCDLRIAARGSVFGVFNRRWGVPLVDGGTQRLPRLIGLGRALDLILSGRPVSSEEALAIGLVTEVVEPGRHLDRALELAQALASFPRAGLLADRRSVLQGLGRPLAEGLELEAANGADALEESITGAARFVEGAGRGGSGTGIPPSGAGTQPLPSGDHPEAT
jgi:enoyl-CoA hydratase